MSDNSDDPEVELQCIWGIDRRHKLELAS